MTIEQLKGLSKKVVGKTIGGENLSQNFRLIMLEITEKMNIVEVSDLDKYYTTDSGIEIYGIDITTKQGIQILFCVRAKELFNLERIIIDLEIVGLDYSDGNFATNKSLEKLLFKE